MAKKVDTEVVARTIQTVCAVAKELKISDAKGEDLRLGRELDSRGIKTPNDGKWCRGKRPEGLRRFIEKHMPEGLPVVKKHSRGEIQRDLLEGAQEGHTTEAVDDTTERTVKHTTHDAASMVDPKDAAYRNTTARVVNTTAVKTPDTTTVVEATTPEIPQHTEVVVRAYESLTDEELQTMKDIINWWNEGGQRYMQRLTSVPVEDLRARPVFPGKKFNSGIRINRRLMDAALAKCKSPREAPRTGGSLSSLIEVLLWGYLDNDERFLNEQSDPTPDDQGLDRPVDTTSTRV